MTGYMFRNGEYVLTLQQLLEIKSRSLGDYKAAFDRIDVDGNGYIEASEVKELLTGFYGGREPPAFEVQTFIKFFDANSDGKISWSEFCKGFGLQAANVPPSSLVLPSTDDADDAGGSVTTVQGNIKVQLETGQEMEVDAVAYLDSLKKGAGMWPSPAPPTGLLQSRALSPSHKHPLTRGGGA